MSNTVAIQLTSQRNGKTFFRPVERALRSRIDFQRDTEPNAKKLLGDFPAGIPGVILKFDKATNEGSVVEPLHQKDYGYIRSIIARRGESLDQEVESFPNAHRPSWLFWMLSLVENGYAVMLEGEILPSEFGGEPVLCPIKLPENQQAKIADQMSKDNLLKYLALPEKAQAQFDKVFGKPF